MLTSPDLDAHVSVRPRPILFLHIPKTAGTSFLTALRNLFSDRHVLRITGTEASRQQQVAAPMQTDLAPVAVVAGHIARSVWQAHLPRLRPFTMLREPVGRVCSLYRFLRKAPPDQLEHLGLERGFSLDQFLNSRAAGTFGQLHNGMTRMLAARADLNDPNVPAFWSQDAMLDALAETQNFLADTDFGVAENMTDSLRLLQQAWDIPYPIAEYHENTTHDDSLMAAVDLQQIISCNTVDLALYHTARQLFQNRVRRLAPIAAISAQGVWQPRRGVETPTDEIPGRQGFYDFEEIGFAWAMQRPTPQINFLAPEGCRGCAVQIALRVYMISPVYQADDFLVHVDGVRIPCAFAARDGDWADLVAGPLVLADGHHCLTIEPAYNLPVRELDPGSHDPRHLSFALASVQFRDLPR